MWPLEVIKHMNNKQDQSLPIDYLIEEIFNINFNEYSFKILSRPIKYNKVSYNYIVPNNDLGDKIIHQMLANPDAALFVKELDIYLL
tara:strand:- start:3786 stop:4046 length:261 start_codon:yes stop_codon:yes gene_type:complete